MHKRSVLTHSATFLAGATSAAIVLSLAWALSLDALVDGIVAGHLWEQELLAARARRENDALAEIVHATNAAYLAEERGLAWATRWHADDGLIARARFPLLALSDPVDFDPEKLALGQQISAALAHARAALVLERAGLEDLAAKEWQRADELHPTQGIDFLRKAAEGSQQYSDLATEEAFLDSETGEELHQRLTAIRANHYDQIGHPSDVPD